LRLQVCLVRSYMWTSLKALLEVSLPPKTAMTLGPVSLHMVWYMRAGPLAIEVHSNVL
jgi:hypothetical protein